MTPLERLKNHVCSISAEPRFIHYVWFVEHHLSIIEQLVEELLVKYPTADADVCRAMVWVHDWGKIITNKGPDEDQATLNAIDTLLPTFGYPNATIQRIRSVFREMEDLTPLDTDFLLETKIISSADGLAHYIGPFFSIYWHENPSKDIASLVAENARMAFIRDYASANRPTCYLG